ncbi:actin-related protein 2/3 complex subunit 5 [Phakopsora pachyrhizi]|uniref:Actin-related protein 2/3 complex subunit 5 n=1 Tax=Phakopsora pachyrhizi TaxID=170000 RepID=A0AAV0AMP8_PHAPC|nr:actin-related protein 2/3 complex subunit 5 [Phakopsora pachyrhizi]CAH7668759.1 actin-related protein 2/3 complex subunit 5 [Phakopsora pachyrhizi]
MDNNFRKIDIDAYDDDLLTEQELYDQDHRSPEQILNEAQSKTTQARSYLTRGDISSALKLLLKDPPYGTSSNSNDLLEQAKSLTLSSIIEILSSTKTSEISSILKTFDNERESQSEWLMKYLYKAMASLSDQNNYAVLLNWHEKLTEVAGTGCIVRVMTDRKRV